DAQAILKKYNITPPAAVERYLREAKKESIKPDDPCLAAVENHLIICPQDALEAAAAFARQQGITPIILGNAIEGEARDVALVMAGIAKQVTLHDQPLPAPCVIISGGETTVTVKGQGKGGRNSEFLLHFMMDTAGHPRIYAISCGTDGSDGTEENAGAILHPDTLQKALDQKANPKIYAANNDSYSFFKLTDGIVDTGPTLTNVNDFRAIYVTK
ncbi:MAG: glycerate kinase, partial [Alphaproteobacteria bacterium]|nr:glycerate kinase [Alphaproteobacteria bacterium]